MLLETFSPADFRFQEAAGQWQSYPSDELLLREGASCSLKSLCLHGIAGKSAWQEPALRGQVLTGLWVE